MTAADRYGPEWACDCDDGCHRCDNDLRAEAIAEARWDDDRRSRYAS